MENENAFLTICDTGHGNIFYLHRNSRITASQLLIVHKTTDRSEQAVSRSNFRLHLHSMKQESPPEWQEGRGRLKVKTSYES